MDLVDKTLLLKLVSNCRMSYREIARELGLTCPTVKRRVDRLLEAGVIEGFTADLSQETLGVGWAYAEIETDLSENRASLISDICRHRSTVEAFAVGSRTYVAFAETPYPDGVYDYGRYLRTLQGVTSVRISMGRQLPTGQITAPCRYTSRGKRGSFTPHQLKMLKLLASDGRISILDLAEKTGYRPKHVRRLLRELENSEAVHFTTRFNPTAEGKVSFILKVTLDESSAVPEDVACWIAETFRDEHWVSLLLLDKPVIVSYMSADSPASIESIIRTAKAASFVRDVETMLIYHVEKSVDQSLWFLEEYSQQAVSIAPLVAT